MNPSAPEAMPGIVRRLFLLGSYFAIVGFVLGLDVSGAVIRLWVTALGHHFVAPSPGDLLWAHLRFGLGCGLLAAGAPYAAALHPRTDVTVRRSLVYGAVSALFCVALVLVVRAQCAHFSGSDTDNMSPIEFPTIWTLPLSLSPTLAGALTLALAGVLRLASSIRALRALAAVRPKSPRYEC